MTQSSPMPPPVLANARVLEYALLDESVRYSGHSTLFADGKELGRVPCLAICQGFDKPEILLLHCDRDWTVLGVVGCTSVTEAKKRSDWIYSGLSTRWIEVNVTEQEAVKYRDASWGDLRCTCCGRTPHEVKQLIEKGGAHICDSCIEELHQMLHEKSSVTPHTPD